MMGGHEPDRFHGRILGAGSGSGLRLVVGDWASSPLGGFTDVMVATAENRRVLLAPDEAVADYVARTYVFDEVVRCPVVLTGSASGWWIEAGPLSCRIGIGARTATGWALSFVPAPITRSRLFAVLADPVARVVHPGVRTHGSAGHGRREYYGAHDQLAVTSLTGTWGGDELGALADVTPSPRFGFSSTPRRPCLTRVTTTVVGGVPRPGAGGPPEAHGPHASRDS